MSIDSAIKSAVESVIRSTIRPEFLLPSGPPVTPDFWLDSLDPATLFQDAAMTTPAVAEADPVGCWKDKGAGAKHAVQATAGKRLFLESGDVANDGTARHLEAPVSISGASFAMLLAVRRDDQNIRAVCGHRVVSGDWTLRLWSSANIGFTIAGVADYVTSDNGTSNGSHVVGVRFGGSNLKIYRGLTQLLSQGVSAPNDVASLFIGDDSDNSGFIFDGGIKELQAFSTNPSDQDWAAQVAWLGARHGISV